MRTIKEIFRLFFYTGWRRQCLILLAMLLGVAAENMSIASLWPIIGVASGEEIKPSPATRVVTQLLDTVGLSPTLGALLLFLCITITLKFGLSTAGLVYVGREVSRMSTQMRLNLIGAIVRARWSHIISTPVGRLSAALSDEAERAQSAYRAAGNFAARLTETLTYLVGCLWISWEFSVAAIVAAGVLWLAVARFVAMARRAGRAKWRSVHLLSSAVSDLLTSIKTLRAMNRQAYLGRFASVQVNELRKSSQREFYSEAAVRALQEPLLGTMLIGGFFVGYSYFHLGLVELIGVVWLLRRISNGVSTMRGAMQRVAIDGIAFWSIIGLTKAMDEQAEALHGGAAPRLVRQCDFRDVTFSYGEKAVVSSANFSLPVGEVATLIGPSGAGKTTIADLLVGLHEPDQGQVLIDGLPLTDADLARWRGKIGYIPQENILFNDTVLENVTLGDRTIGEAQAIEALRLAGAWGFVSALPRGLHEVIGVRGNLLSGGQKQRLSIARALIHDPELLILDEATSALDRTTAREICDAVRGLRGNRTILAITHQSIWTDVADRILTIRDGEVATEIVN
ncbi:MAG TPA: ABC transporter ATP-binding protein [Dongiaceae bacterium]|jgi:ATP-binding cassette subfamily C protein|nr:ABC transporter ATP-binding protein [Dongiaceae bacterium]